MKIRNVRGCLWIAPAMLWAGAALSNTDADPEGNTYRYEVPGFWNSTSHATGHSTRPTGAPHERQPPAGGHSPARDRQYRHSNDSPKHIVRPCRRPAASS